ncbi:MAG TPA: hypothetical protein VFQ96_07970 [Microbacteriaceae bacterium]|nr:hypothetical protein [Microbacteriaceae bacterium]
MISTAQLYAFNPNVSAQPGATPPAGSLVAQAVAAGGTACGWVYDSGNQSIQFALATPGPKALASLKEKAAADSTPTSAYGDGPNVAGFFHVTGSRGEVQVFTTGHWLVGLSSTFFEPGDAEQLVHDILANLHLG